MRGFSYLDNAATTPLDPEVLDAMLPYLRDNFANPSSLYAEGREAKTAVQQARAHVAALINAEPDEIIFTGSASEANNLAFAGLGLLSGGRSHMITSGIEHPSVIEACHAAQRRGIQVTFLPCQDDGITSAVDLERALQPNTKLVSIMTANNVVGTVQPVAAMAKIAHQHGALFHTDAVQAVGKIKVDVKAQEIDLLSISAHKLYGPKGVGALYVKKGVRVEAIINGGGQERGLRAGTENVAGIVGFGAAAKKAAETMTDETARLVQLRELVIERLEKEIPNCYVIGHRFRRLPGHICVAFSGQENEAIRLLLALDEAGVAISSGSACSVKTGSGHVLEAMGFDPMRARGSLRITLGRFNTEADCERLLQVLPDVVRQLNPISSRNVTMAN